MLTVVGFPRSGTNFLHRMLAHVHSPVRKIHWSYQDKGAMPLVYIYRDPRDCALSGWKYVRHHFLPELEMMEFLEQCFAGHWDLWPQGWREHTRFWSDRQIPTVRYEALCKDREWVLRELLVDLGMGADGDCIANAIAQSYRPEKQPMRSVGRWKKELSPEAVRWLDAYCGDMYYM